MPRSGMVDVRQPIERQPPVTLEALWRRPAVNLIKGLVPRLGMHGIEQTAPTSDFLQSRKNKSFQQTVVEGLMEIANLPQFFLDVALVDFVLVKFQRLRGCVASL